MNKKGLTQAVCLIVLCALQACASKTERQIVAVNSADSGASVPTLSPATGSPALPPAVRQLLAQVEQNLSEGRFSSAEQGLQKAQRLAPSAPRVYLLWGHWARQQQNTARAEQMYRRVLSLSSSGDVEYRQAERALHNMGVN